MNSDHLKKSRINYSGISNVLTLYI